MKNGSIISIEDSEKVLSKNKIMGIIEVIDYEQLFEFMWKETYCRYQNSVYAMLNLQTGEIECNDLFSFSDKYSYLIIREFNISEIKVRNLLNEKLYQEYLDSGRNLETFFKSKRMDDKEVFKQYYVEDWKRCAWFLESLSEENLEKYFNKRKKIEESM